ncbi:ribosomal protein S8 (mitochondrion) [Hemiselmis andersenii]|uniref:Ribosomal protein S8 n=1 Tax=Hemiselmis andersenii TaxID=464988 RepID=B2MWT3_HEMAN|nr:ribosomal protein S8 [Hemiselmis andersenii]ACC78225.1 ribosomal protein S8 [Hemiselmis andersenii]
MSILANFSNILNNGQHKYKHFVKYPASKLILDILTLLFQENLIRGFYIKKIKTEDFAIILLKYGFNKKTSFIPTVASYITNKTIYKHQNGLGLLVLSTSKGIMTNYTSSKLKLGGILLMKIS